MNRIRAGLLTVVLIGAMGATSAAVTAERQAATPPASARPVAQFTTHIIATHYLRGIEGALPTGLEGLAMVSHLTREEMLRGMHPGAR